MAESVDTPAVPFQYATAEQRKAADRLGMWVFLATELMLFGALFTAYTAYRLLYPTTFAQASRSLDLALGSANTVVILLSSLTMALAVRSARVGSRRGVPGFLALTILLGLAFLALKLAEYVEHYHSHLAPGLDFVWTQPNPGQAELFFLLYYAMTGLHAIHLSVGVVLVAVMFILARRRPFTPARAVPIELTGLYWHFVDVIWTFLFPLLYLIGRH